MLELPHKARALMYTHSSKVIAGVSKPRKQQTETGKQGATAGTITRFVGSLELFFLPARQFINIQVTSLYMRAASKYTCTSNYHL